jgi:transcriptional regulator with XRE-family HTH domain
MGFKENLKSELIYSGMMVKELCAKTGIKKHTLDNYLNTHNSLPNAETAVKIAHALDVSVEYLVTGTEWKVRKPQPPLPPDMRLLVAIADKLNTKNRRLAIKLVKVLKEQEDDMGKFGGELYENCPKIEYHGLATENGQRTKNKKK